MSDSGVSAYATVPGRSSPYDSPASLTQRTLQNGLSVVNFARYLAGVPAVSLNAEYSESCQAGAYVMALNDDFSHSPTNKTGMDTSTFNLGYYACGSSNISYSERISSSPRQMTERVFVEPVLRCLADEDPFAQNRMTKK